MRSNKKRNFFSFSRKGGIYKAGMPKNHNMHDKAQAPPPQKHLESWLRVKPQNRTWQVYGFVWDLKVSIVFKDSYYFFIRGKTVKKLNHLNPTLCVMGFNK